MEWHGIKLARYIYTMKWWKKHIQQHQDRVNQLNKLGFVWERLQSQWNIFIDALGCYRTIHGHVMVPATYIVPRDNNEYPKACWDLPLGSIVQRLRLRHDFLTGENAIERKDQLDNMGFVWDVSEYNFIKFLNALRHFDKLERRETSTQQSRFKYSSAIRVPSKFIVPSGDESWPRELWDYQLGAKCMAVRQKQLYVKGYPERKQALEDIGFRWSGNASLGWLDVVHAAAIYSQMHGRVLNVPLSFVVPAPPCDNDPNILDSKGIWFTSNGLDSWPWPERLWGLKLGQRLKDVRLKGAYLKGRDRNLRKAQLDNLGFVWNPKRGRRKRCIDMEEEEDVVGDDDTVCTVVE